MKKLLLLVLFFISHLVVGQSIQLSPPIPVDLNENVTIRDVIYVNDQILMVGQIRHKDSRKIDGYLALINEGGEVLKESYTREDDGYGQFSKVIQNENSLYVLENLSKSGQSVISIHTYDLDLEKIDSRVIQEKQYNEGVDFQFIDNENLLVAIWDGNDPFSSFPLIKKINLTSSKIISKKLDQKNSGEVDFKGVDESWTQEMKESFQKLEQYQESKMVKHVLRMVFDDNHIYILGCESSSSISDYWICKLDLNLNVIWERIYEDPDGIGADWLLDGYIKEKNLHLVGYKYNKKLIDERVGYDFNYLVADSNGKFIIDNNFDFGQHEVVEGMLNFENRFIQYGQSLSSVNGYVDFDHPDAPKQLLALLIESDGNLKHKCELNIPGLKKVKYGIKISPHSFYLIGSRTVGSELKPFLLRGDIVGDKP